MMMSLSSTDVDFCVVKNIDAHNKYFGIQFTFMFTKWELLIGLF